MRVALAGLAALAVAMGIGRFAFTPLLPMMQAEAALTLVQGGWLASANYAGYLAGALWAGAQPAPPAWAIRGGLLAIAASTLAMALVRDMGAWLLLRAAAGVASAWVLVHVAAWSMQRLAPLARPILSGVVYAGVGAGIALAGLTCLAVLRLKADSSIAWAALGAGSLAVCAVLWPAFAPSADAKRAARGPGGWGAGWTRLVLCYGAFGFGYIIPATYLPAMARDALADAARFGWAWPIFGLAATVSTLAVAPLLGRVRARRLWALCHGAMALGVAGPLAFPGLAGILLAAVLVGGTFVAVTMLGMQEAWRIAGERAPRLMAVMTAAFAAGQIAGPGLVTAWLGVGGALPAALALASLLLLGSGIALLVRPGPAA